MNSKTLNNLRVVVHVIEDNYEDHIDSAQNINTRGLLKFGFKRNTRGQVVDPPVLQSLNENPEFDRMKAEVLLIDDKSLLLNLSSTEEDDVPHTNISHKMYFDRACPSTVDAIKNELAIIMDVLLLKRKNACITHFALQQEMNINLFFDLLITFLNKRLYHQKQKLQNVKLDCLEIAASLPKSQTSHAGKGFTMRANFDSEEDCVYDSRTSFRPTRYMKNQFRTTRDLLLWLVNEYRYKFADNKGHEKLEFSFSIVDHHKNLFKVKLSLFNIFLNVMNTADRNQWQHYMDHMGEGCKGLDCNFVHSGLTISLLNYIEGITSDNTLLLFDVPTNHKMTVDTIEMLQMAHSVVKNRKSKLLNAQVELQNSRKRQSLKRNEEYKYSYNKERRSSLPFCFERQSMGGTLCDSAYTSEDFNNLSCWYRKIDECFEKNRHLREKYFNCFFKLKNKQILSNIDNMFQALESLYSQQNERDLVELQEDQVELHELFESYDNVKTQFRKISQDIKNTHFEEILKVYLETKAYDLNNQVQDSIQKHLKLCQEHVNLAFYNLNNKIKVDLDFQILFY